MSKSILKMIRYGVFVGGLALVGCGKSLTSNSTAPSNENGGTPKPNGTSYFAIGLMNSPGDTGWMKNSNVPWNFRYQYLSGGANTGFGWSTWNSNGDFAKFYMDDSNANGYIPVLTYYVMVQSLPANGNESAIDSNFTNAATMASYFADWKLLMQKAGAFSKPVVIHIEPDMWAFMQSKHGDDPANTSVKVGSSGFAELSGFEDNARGFAKALVSIKNTYAPNAFLAFHASFWATGTDLILSHADPVVIGDRISNFYNALASNFDLIFYDLSDRDAGFKQYVYGDGGASWWVDADFTRFRQFLAEVNLKTGRKGMLWQVPIGNTLYATMNNTSGHYQDNRAEYFLKAGNRQHIVDYAGAGVTAILFGGGASNTTSYEDTMKDGITNPAPINGNTLQATSSDDDGGFLRISSGAYYASGPVLVSSPVLLK